MRTVDLIEKKRDGGELTAREIRFLIEGYTNGDIPDYQIAAWAMAVYFQGMSPAETAELTMAMARSGKQLDLSPIAGIKVDKHSTGGVGDTTTLVLAPLVAAAGVPVAKMSGRGLGHTGGTIDKLEAIAGFHAELDQDAFIRQVNEIGAAVMGQSGNMTPADKKLYALRDVTATVNAIPLIASSIMSKKIAAGAGAIVLDVKTGGGAFMKTEEDSLRLAQAMVDIGTQVGRETVALISSMDQPLGYAVGNALEVREAIDTLNGRGPADLTELCIALGALMLVLGGVAADEREARATLRRLIDSGAAFDKFKALAAAQGGDIRQLDQPDLLPRATHRITVIASERGYVSAIEAEQIGIAAMTLGAGRETKDSAIDLAAGVVLAKKAGDTVQPGEPLAVLHYNRDDGAGAAVAERVKQAFSITAEPPEKPRLITAIVTKQGTQRA